MQNVPISIRLNNLSSLKQLDIFSSTIGAEINIALSAVSCHGIPIVSKRVDPRPRHVRTDVAIESGALRRGYRQR